MLIKKALTLAALFALAAGPLQTNAAPVVTEDYVAGFVGDATMLCASDEENLTGMNMGGACFDKPANRSRAIISIDDAAVEIAGFWVSQYNAAGDCLSNDPELDICWLDGPFCGSQSYSLDPSTARIRVVLDGFVYGPIDCTESGGFTTIGTITSDFRV